MTQGPGRDRDGSHEVPRRRRNPRGQGHRLREEIVAGAAALIEQTGTEESITLRAVARKIGISAPSIAPHFADREQIIDAVVAEEAAALGAALLAAAADTADPVGRLLSVCEAYVAFGRSHPHRYRVLTERRYLDEWAAGDRPMTGTAPVLAHLVELGVGLVQACVDAGRSDSSDADRDAHALWMFLHGAVALPLFFTSVAWPPLSPLLAEGVTRLARLRPPLPSVEE